jgi:hypothetical protein
MPAEQPLATNSICIFFMRRLIIKELGGVLSLLILLY